MFLRIFLTKMDEKYLPRNSEAEELYVGLALLLEKTRELHPATDEKDLIPSNAVRPSKTDLDIILMKAENF